MLPTACPKPESHAREKCHRNGAKYRTWQKVRQAVLARDGRICRACGLKGGIDVHHIRFRSLGGSDSTANCAALCKPCHDDIHAYRLTLTGDANGKLKIWRDAPTVERMRQIQARLRKAG